VQEFETRASALLCYALLFKLVACSRYSIALGNKVIRSDCRVYGFLWHKGKVQVSRRKFGPRLDLKYDISLNTNHKLYITVTYYK